MLSNKSINLFIGIFAACFILFCGYEVHGTWLKKHNSQEANFKKLVQTRLRLENVAEYGEQFNSAFLPVDDVPDLLTLFERLRIGEFSNTSPDSIELVSINNMTGAGKRLPLYEICLSNTGNGFEISPDSVEDALIKTSLIDKRGDIRYKEVKLVNDNRGLSLVYDSLCILGRISI